MNQNSLAWGPMHVVEVPCTCPDASDCRIEKYIADIRILDQENKDARNLLRQLSQWDHLDGSGDGSYWRSLIFRVLYQ